MSHLLLVDDDDAIRDAVAGALETEGFRVDSVGNGEEALAWLADHREAPPQMILLDLMMPVMDGLEFLDVYRRRADLPEVPVIVLSANLMSLGIQRSDVLLYLKKPIDLDHLIATLETWCPSRAPIESSAPQSHERGEQGHRRERSGGERN